MLSNPSTILTGYPYFSDSDLNEIAKLLNTPGTGISNLKFVDVPKEIVKIRFQKNHTFVIEKIDRCLHPIITEKIIELFFFSDTKRN